MHFALLLCLSLLGSASAAAQEVRQFGKLPSEPSVTVRLEANNDTRTGTVQEVIRACQLDSNVAFTLIAREAKGIELTIRLIKEFPDAEIQKMLQQVRAAGATSVTIVWEFKAVEVKQAPTSGTGSCCIKSCRRWPDCAVKRRQRL